MIELTQEQVMALGRHEPTPRCVINPQTQEVYVLVPLADYEESYDDNPWTDEERDFLREEACEMLDDFGKKL